MDVYLLMPSLKFSFARARRSRRFPPIYDVEIPIRMNFPIPQIRPHRGRKHPHLVNRPAQRPRK